MGVEVVTWIFFAESMLSSASRALYSPAFQCRFSVCSIKKLGRTWGTRLCTLAVALNWVL